MNKEKQICVAILSSSHGVQGDVKLKIFLENPNFLKKVKHFYDENGDEISLKIKAILPKSGAIATLEGVTIPEEINNLRGKKIFCNFSEFPEIQDENEFYYEQLVGLDIVQNGQIIGKVKAVMNHGASDLIELKLNDGSEEFVEFTKANFPEISIKDGKITFVS